MVTKSISIGLGLEQILGGVASQLELPPSAHAEVSQHYVALADLLSETLADYEPSLFAQGSYRLRTTVRPLEDEEFDLDFVSELQAPLSDDPESIFELVAGAIAANGRYADKMERRDRCIRVRFANSCHLDIVPAIPDPEPHSNAILIADRREKPTTWSHSDPKGYVAWFENLSRTTALYKAARDVEPLPPVGSPKSPLQIIVQLLKRYHQLHVAEPYRTSSIVLTTICGESAPAAHSLSDGMSTVVNGVVGLARSPRHVHHPTTPGEVLSTKWNEPEVFARYCSSAEALAADWVYLLEIQGTGYEEVAEHLSRMFGEAPVVSALKDIGDAVRRETLAGRIATVAGGAIASVPSGFGNPRKSFYGSP